VFLEVSSVAYTNQSSILTFLYQTKHMYKALSSVQCQDKEDTMSFSYFGFSNIISFVLHF